MKSNVNIPAGTAYRVLITGINAPDYVDPLLDSSGTMSISNVQVIDSEIKD